MRLIVVNDETDLADLRRRVLRAGVSAEGRRTVEDAIRTANPHLDLDRLSRGTVLVLPDSTDIADDVNDGGAATYVAVLDRMSEELGTPRPTRPKLVGGLDRPALRELIGSAEVRTAIAADTRVALEVSRFADALTAEEDKEAAETESRAAAAQEWRAGLAELREVLRTTPGQDR